MKTNLITIHSAIWRNIKRLLFGGSCASCGAIGPAICRPCLASIPLSSITEHDGIYGIYNYGHPLVSHAVWNLKYSHRGQEAKLLAEKGQETITDIISEQLQSATPEKVIFVPIPQYRKKTQSRGFNQSFLIARWFAKEVEMTEVRDILEKYKETLPQSHISSKEGRIKNIHNTMRVRGNINSKQIYVIVDDVTTTGATFLEAMRALKSVGAKHIICIALAHGYKRR